MAKVMNGEVDALDLLAKVRRAWTVHAAIGDPIKSGGITILPVARVTGGGGGAVVAVRAASQTPRRTPTSR